MTFPSFSSLSHSAVVSLSHKQPLQLLLPPGSGNVGYDEGKVGFNSGEWFGVSCVGCLRNEREFGGEQLRLLQQGGDWKKNGYDGELFNEGSINLAESSAAAAALVEQMENAASEHPAPYENSVAVASVDREFLTCFWTDMQSLEQHTIWMILKQGLDVYAEFGAAYSMDDFEARFGLICRVWSS
ncbi:unnamed protein product [Vicia faba]|uniref:Uncharacterized protein n=1 Tax=Vicia faba TaxID=3906 RepID=A0AAV0ZRN6_VICFA|nr:unnamed protein product [Vicia faba]